VLLPPLVFEGVLPTPYGDVFYTYSLDRLAVGLACILFALSLGQMRKSQTGRKKLVELWTQVREQELHTGHTAMTDSPAQARTAAGPQSTHLDVAPNEPLREPGAA
jgi:hypothetical protein